jgi:dienelactone hydrolase
VCLIFDPIGQGERLQFPNGRGGSTVGVGVAEHLQAGNPQFLVGEFFGAWRAWDGIRALDYLLTRPEVDPKHVGVTGNSGGGTLTTWLFGLDPRWTMGAPSCFVTTFRRNLENELPADTEQCPPHALALGLDHDDFLVPAAPRPLILLTKEKDYFDQRGARTAFERLKRLYTALGKPDAVEFFTGPTTHGYSQENREAMYRFFNRLTKVSDAQKEPELKLEDPKDLQVTMTGQVAEMHSHPLMFFTEAASKKLAGTRGKPRGDELRRRVSRLLDLPERKGAPEYRILRPLRRNPGWARPFAANYAIETAPGIQAIAYMPMGEAWTSRPPRGPGDAGSPVLVYVPHLSSDLDLAREPLIQNLAAKVPDGTPYFCVDLRGMGESQPNTCGLNTFSNAYGCDFMYAIHGVMLDDPLVAQRVHDLLAVFDWLEEHGYPRIQLAARGHGTIPAVLAALLDRRVVEVRMQNMLRSYAEIAEADRSNWPLSSYLFGVLKHFDLPDVREELIASRRAAFDILWGPEEFKFDG